VVVTVTPEGVRIAPPAAPSPARPPTPPTPPKPPAEPGAVPSPPPQPAAAAAAANDAEVKVSKDGVRIVTTKDGKRVALQIDDKGVRVEEIGSGAAAEAATGPRRRWIGGHRSRGAGRPRQDRGGDRIGARADRGDRPGPGQPAGCPDDRVYRERSSDWVISFLMLLIVTSVIAKVLLGGKRRRRSGRRRPARPLPRRA